MALGATRVVLFDGTGGRQGLDVADGTLSDVPDDAAGWCLRQLPDLSLVGLRDTEGFRVASPQRVPCRADGTPLEVPAALDDELATVVDDVVVWADAGGVHAARKRG